jgi:hypothetical protein
VRQLRVLGDDTPVRKVHQSDAEEHDPEDRQVERPRFLAEEGDKRAPERLSLDHGSRGKRADNECQDSPRC